MKNITKCPNCGGNLKYSPVKKAVWCEHCDSSFPVEVAQRKVKLLHQYSLDYVPSPMADEINQYFCNNCKSTYIVDKGKTSRRCPNCASTDITQTNSSSTCPDGIIPFEITKEKAAKVFENWLKHRLFAPHDLYLLARNEKLSGVYVPVFNINATSVTHYAATVKKVHVDNNTNTVFSTVHNVRDSHQSSIIDKAYCANTAIDQSLIDSIVGVDQSKIVPYSSDYIFGYYGSDTNISVHDIVKNIEKSAHQKAENNIRSELKNKYDEIISLNCNSRLTNITFNYLYTPIYMNHYKYKNKEYHCYIDGTTGKVAGKSPKSALKILAFVGGVLLAVGAIALLIAKLI